MRNYPIPVKIINQPKVYPIKALCVMSYIVTDANQWKELRQQMFVCAGKEDMLAKIMQIHNEVRKEMKAIDKTEIIIDLVDPSLIKEVVNSYANPN
jgi:hypothetical protein